MKTRFVVLAMVIACAALLGWSSLALAQGGTVEVSQPVQLTSNNYYERGQSITYDGSEYWLFYGRSDTVTGNYGDSNPDVHDYRVYYKKAATIPDLAVATPMVISATHNISGYLGETGATYFGGDVWSFATVISGTEAVLYGWYTGDGGTTWTEVGPIISGLSTGQAHHDEIAFGGELWVLEGSGNFTTMHSSTPKTGGWSTPLVVDADPAITGGLGHFYVDGGSLYLALYSNSKNYIYKYNDTTVAWDKVDEIAPPEKYDPTLFKVGSTYVFAQAPWDGTRQYIIAWSNDTLDGSFFDAGHTMVTEGQYGSNPWVDMWPIGFTTAGGQSYLFFTSERNPDDPSAEIDGNIWYLEVDWDLSRDHYTYIQEAVRDASSGDTVHVAAGTYVEQVEITKTLTLAGEDVLSTTIQSPDELTLKFTTSADNYPIVYIHDTDDVAVQDLTVDGAGKGNANYRFVGIGFRNAGGAVDTVTVKDVRDTPFSGSQHGVGLYAYNSDAISRTIQVYDSLFTGWQKTAVALNAAATTPLVVDVRRNTIVGHGATDITAQNGIQVWADQASGTVADNTLSGIAYDNTNDPIKWVATTILNGFSDLTITGNTITGAHVGVYNYHGPGLISENDLTIEKIGVYAWGIIATDPPGAVPSPFGAEKMMQMPSLPHSILAQRDVQVLNNTIVFSGTDNSATYGIEADAGWGPDDLAFTASHNFVEGFEAGIELYQCESGCDTGLFTQLVATGNSLVSNTYGMRSNVTYLLPDGGSNWWGTNTPTGVASAISGTIDYTPWLDSGADTEPGTPGFQGDFATLWVDDDSLQVGTVGRIQEGVNLASDTVHAAAGTYVEQVEISKTLTLVGEGMFSTTVQSPDTLPLKFTSTADNHPILYVHGADPVTIQDLTVDGAGKGNANYRFVGIAFHDAGGMADAVQVKGMHDTPLSNAEHGVGLYVYNADDVTHTVQVQDSLFVDWQKNALAFSASDTTPLTVDVRRNTITGYGPTDVLAQNGIEIWARQGSSTIVDNTLSDIAYDNTNLPFRWVASGILNYYGDLTVLSNTITSAQMGIYNYDGEAQIIHNDLTIEKVGMASWGILAADPPAARPAPFTAGARTYRAASTPLTLTVQVLSNTLTLSGTVNESTYGIEADAGWGADNLDFVANYNTIEGFESGIELYQCQSQCSSGLFANLTTRWNCFADNTYGIRSNVSYLVADGRENYWGDPSGPYHPTLHPSGQGDAVSDYVDFRYWTSSCGGSPAVFYLYLPLINRGQ